jgi:hypothetical protein
VDKQANIKIPDDLKDRDLLVKELRQDLQDLLNDSSVGIDRLAELAQTLKDMKKAQKRK